jgi:hypothetical protein
VKVPSETAYGAEHFGDNRLHLGAINCDFVLNYRSDDCARLDGKKRRKVCSGEVLDGNQHDPEKKGQVTGHETRIVLEPKRIFLSVALATRAGRPLHLANAFNLPFLFDFNAAQAALVIFCFHFLPPLSSSSGLSCECRAR